MSLIAGNAFGPPAEKPYLLVYDARSRFFIAVALFVLMERQVEERLLPHLGHFARAPLLASRSFEPAAGAVTRAVKRRDAPLAEAICLIIAVLATVGMWINLLNVETPSWAVRVSKGEFIDRRGLVVPLYKIDLSPLIQVGIRSAFRRNRPATPRRAEGGPMPWRTSVSRPRERRSASDRRHRYSRPASPAAVRGRSQPDRARRL